MKIYNEYIKNDDNHYTLTTICDLCMKLAEVEFLSIVRLNNINIHSLNSINDVDEYTDINVLGMTYYLTEELTTEALIRVAESVQYHINKEVIPNIEIYNRFFILGNEAYAMASL